MQLIRISFVLFLLSVVFLGLITLFESVLTGITVGLERFLTFLLLVMPAATGAVLAALSLKRREGSDWGAVALLALNTLFALFHLMILLVAG